MWLYKSTFPPAVNTYLLAYTITNTYQTVHIFFLSKEWETSISLPGIWYNFCLNDGIIILHKAHSIKQTSTVMWYKHSTFENSYTLNPTLVLWSCTENTIDILFMSKFTLFDIIFQKTLTPTSVLSRMVEIIVSFLPSIRSQMSTSPLNTKISSHPLPKPKE